MRLLKFNRATGLCLVVMLPILLIVGCSTGTDSLRARMTAANLLAASAAQELVTATQAGTIEPGSETATAISQTLDAVERSLDSAGSALRAGLPEMASRNLDAAEQQLNTLQPMLPLPGGE